MVFDNITICRKAKNVSFKRIRKPEVYKQNANIEGKIRLKMQVSNNNFVWSEVKNQVKHVRKEKKHNPKIIILP